MKIDAALLVHDLNQMPAVARFADAAGFDGIWTFETSHQPFLPLVLAAEHSSRLSLGTSIVVAFARSPTILAQIAWDLARFSRGRFILGLGTQVKGHNERRFGVKWERPWTKCARVILAAGATGSRSTRRVSRRELFVQRSVAGIHFYAIPISRAGLIDAT